MNLTWLISYKAIVDTGSMSEAARSLHLTQPAISKQLRSLEEYYGTVLFCRSTRSMELTPEGKTVYQYCLKILDLLDKSKTDVQALSHKLEGEIRLGASNIPGEYLLPRYLGLLQQRYPGLRVKLEIGDSREIASQVAEGKLELGIIGAPLNSRTLQLELLYNDSLVVVVPRNHRYAGRKTITLQEFLREPLIAREVGSGTRSAIEERLSTAGIPPNKLQIRLELGSNETVLNAVTNGLGISLVSWLAAEPRERSGEITCLNISDLPMERGLYLATRKSPPLKWNLTVVSDFLKQVVQADQALAAGLS